MEFLCKVGTPSGEIVERSFEAQDLATLKGDLERQGYYLFTARGGLATFRLRRGRRRVRARTLIIFTQQLAALLKAGLPLLQSLNIMLERQRDVAFRKSLEDVRDKVKGGVALSEAFREEGDLYPPMFSASLIAGERSGALETVLRRFVAHLRIQEQLRKKVMAAAIYPLLLVGLMIVLSAVLVVEVVPKFKEFFDGLGSELPAPTRALLALSIVVRAWSPWILGATLGLVAMVVISGRRPSAVAARDRLMLRVPYLGGLARMYATSQLTRSLGTLLAGGLPLVQALEVAASSIGNRAMGLAVGASVRLIHEGSSLNAALESTGLFQNLPLEMVRVGEQTGALADMLNAVSDFYDEDLEIQMQTVLSLVEPVLLICMAVLVAGLVLSIYLPMFQAIANLQARG
jgi:type IV pilus assembly protein PilC